MLVLCGNFVCSMYVHTQLTVRGNDDGVDEPQNEEPSNERLAVLRRCIRELLLRMHIHTVSHRHAYTSEYTNNTPPLSTQHTTSLHTVPNSTLHTQPTSLSTLPHSHTHHTLLFIHHNPLFTQHQALFTFTSTRIALHSQRMPQGTSSRVSCSLQKILSAHCSSRARCEQQLRNKHTRTTQHTCVHAHSECCHGSHNWQHSGSGHFSTHKYNVYVRTYVRAYVHTYVCVHLHICIHHSTHAHKHIHTYVHMLYMHVHQCWGSWLLSSIPLIPFVYRCA